MLFPFHDFCRSPLLGQGFHKHRSFAAVHHLFCKNNQTIPILASFCTDYTKSGPKHRAKKLGLYLDLSDVLETI